ncbi:hypothetical protein F4782DRAFT_536446 [Xylaria castorea]|nr:hypothetical protein F4782DRAFT_536446 [Xylaria castorea]
MLSLMDTSIVRVRHRHPFDPDIGLFNRRTRPNVPSWLGTPLVSPTAQVLACLSVLATVEGARQRTQWSYQNTIAIADMIGRATAAAIIGVFIVIPLVVLPYRSKNTQTPISSILILAFVPLVTVLLRVSNLEMMVVTGA